MSFSCLKLKFCPYMLDMLKWIPNLMNNWVNGPFHGYVS